MQPTPHHPATISIRQATLTDIPLIRQLAQGTWAPTYQHILSPEQLQFMFDEIYNPASLQQQLTERQHTFLLLFLNGEAAGFASFGLLQPEPAIYKLHKIYLLPTVQGRGAGKALLQAAETEVKNRNATALHLNVNRYNPALHFYQKQGYQIIREEDIPIGPYWMNDFVLGKKL